MTALATIGSNANLKDMLGKMAPSLAGVLPKHVTPERVVKLAMVAANKNPAILKCTQMSVMQAVMQSSELGLDCSGTMGEAYIVPYRDTATLIVGYRGLAKLARQSGEIKRIETNVVREHDLFDYRQGTEFRLDFARKIDGDRGDAIGAYALVEMTDGSYQSDFMTADEIENIRLGSPSKNSPAWKNHYGEMARKTVFRRVAKWLPMTNEKFADAIMHEDNNSPLIARTAEPTPHKALDLADALDGVEDPPSKGEDAAGDTPLSRLTNALRAKTGADHDTCEARMDEVMQAMGEGFYEADVLSKIEAGGITVG